MPGAYMNQSTLTVVCVFLSSILSTVGATYQTNKSNEEKEQRAVIQITTEFSGVKASVDNFGTQLSALTTSTGVLESEVDSLQEFRRDISKRVRDLEMKGH